MSAFTDDDIFLKSFEAHGVNFTRMVDENNAVANCPFSGGKEKFYVNKLTGQWDSKNTGRSGNLYSFLDQIYTFHLEGTSIKDLLPLSQSRKIPAEIFFGKVAWNNSSEKYLIPCRSIIGAITDVGTYSISGKGPKGIRRTGNTKVNINGLPALKTSHREAPVYVFEGEWDWFAGQWLHKVMQYESVCLCLPGAGTFKGEWLEYFRDRKVKFCYDNDNAGREGENKAKQVRGIASSVEFFCWPEKAEDGKDIRDVIIELLNGDPGKATKKEVISCFSIIEEAFGDETYDERHRPIPIEEKKAPVEIPDHKELEAIFLKWMELNTLDPIAVVYGTYFANKMEGDPVWTFLVGPPSSNKTEFLLSLSQSPYIETTSTLTPTSLVSGMRHTEGQDPSLIPRLDGRVLVIKDFTTILSANAYVRDDIFGILRDAYDGKVEKIFGTGIKKSYESKFGIISGVTPAIDAFGSMNSSLGERFIKFRLDETITEEVEIARMMKAFENINQEKKIRLEIQEVGARMAEKQIPSPENMPKYGNNIRDTVIGCARYTAMLRGVVNKEKYSKEQLTKPVREIAIRLAKQFMKLCQGIAIYYDHDTVGENEIRIIRKVARDTAPDRTEDIVRKIYLLGDDVEVDTQWLIDNTKLSSTTISSLTADLLIMGILTKISGQERFKNIYKLDSDLRRSIDRGGIYSEFGSGKGERKVPAPTPEMKVPGPPPKFKVPHSVPQSSLKLKIRA